MARNRGEERPIKNLAESIAARYIVLSLSLSLFLFVDRNLILGCGELIECWILGFRKFFYFVSCKGILRIVDQWTNVAGICVAEGMEKKFEIREKFRLCDYECW